MSISTMPRSWARRRMLSSSGPAKIPGKSVKRSNRSRGLRAAARVQTRTRVFVRLRERRTVKISGAAATSVVRTRSGRIDGSSDRDPVVAQPDRSHPGATGARDVEAE